MTAPTEGAQPEQGLGQATPERTGEIFDLGFRRYEGAREGRRRARRAIWRDGVRASLGLGRSLSSKILPIVIIGITVAPALIIVAVLGFAASFGGDLEGIDEATNREYYGFAFFPLLLFAASIGPELLCPERRNGVLTLYFVRPLTPTDYVASKWVAFFTVMLAVLLIPQLLVLTARALDAPQPLDFLRDNLELLPRIVGAGAVIAVFFTTLALAVSSLTERRPYAAAGILGVIIVSSAVGGIGGEIVSGSASDVMELVNLGGVLLGVSDSIFGAYDRNVAEVPNAITLSAVTAVGLAVLWYRYRTVRT